jgi:hypothetical protein
VCVVGHRSVVVACKRCGLVLIDILDVDVAMFLLQMSLRDAVFQMIQGLLRRPRTHELNFYFTTAAADCSRTCVGIMWKKMM